MRLVLILLVLAIVAGGAVLYGLYQTDIAVARALVEGRSRTVETSFGTMNYAEQGAGPPLLVVHGAGGGFDQAFDSAGALAANHRIIAPSRFGYLGSAVPPNASAEMQADAFVDLLDRLGIEKVSVLGISAGAMSAIEFAIRHPDRITKLALLVPAAYSPTRVPGGGTLGGSVVEGIMRTLLGSDFMFWAGVRFFPGAMTGMILATDPELVRAASPDDQARASMTLHHILPISPRIDGLVYDGIAVSTAHPPPAFDKITCPVLAISAKDDRYGTADTVTYIAGHVANARIMTFDTGGHVMIGHNAEVLRMIGDFVDAVS